MNEEAQEFFNLALDHFHKQEYLLAKYHLDIAIDIEPKIADLYFYRGKNLEMLGNYEEAIADYEKAAKESVTNSRDMCKFRIASAKAKLGDYEKAIECYNELIFKYPYNSIYYYELGKIYYELENMDFAKDMFYNAFYSAKQTEQNTFLMQYKGAFNLVQGDYKKAIENFNKVISQLGPQTEDDLFYLKGNAYEKLEEYEKAKKIYKMITFRNPKNICYQKALNRLEKILEKRSEYELNSEIENEQKSDLVIKKPFVPKLEIGTANGNPLDSFTTPKKPPLSMELEKVTSEVSEFMDACEKVWK